VSWGSTYGALVETLNNLNKKDAVVRMIQISEIWPFPQDAFVDLMKGSQKFIVVESNATGQMAHLIRAETGLKASGKILRYDGRPITPAYIIKKFKEEVKI
jgi:2-oxoglutarate ferredoxin oxidoreductase subunit alpha